MQNGFRHYHHAVSACSPSGELLEIGGGRALLMGILNVTPDSFSDGGRFIEPAKAIEHALRMAEEGADIVDIGGESSRPGAQEVSAGEELDRVMPVIEGLKGKLNKPISIDTRRSAVARAACQAGAVMINDISGLQNDPQIAATAAEFGAWLVLMHMRGTPATMQLDIHYDDLLGEIVSFLESAADKAMAAGVAKSKIIIDPGIGFGKTTGHNLTILKNLNRFVNLGYPVLIGVSRKSFIGNTLGLPVEQRLEGSLAAALYAVLKGAAIVRAHDVLETRRALKIIEAIEEAEE